MFARVEEVDGLLAGSMRDTGEAARAIFDALREAGGRLEGSCLLHIACRATTLPGATIMAFLDAGLAVDDRDEAGRTPLWYAARCNSFEYVKLPLLALLGGAGAVHVLGAPP